MPLRVEVDAKKEMILVSGEGVVTDDDLLEYVQEYLLGSDLRGFDELFDLSEADLQDLTYAGLSSVAAAAAASDSDVAPTKIAILISEARGMGVSRLYQSLRESKGGRRHTRVFWDRTECLEWLGLTP
ncbi:MAG: hypothetical protein HKO65_15250 [Gemmatimonadetes bacterium]|nr:hypothetical protein [Gemmatimonadota bacterium]NNM06448.1 hypothetical protein [Gemmatimonadota bacterium]